MISRWSSSGLRARWRRRYSVRRTRTTRPRPSRRNTSTTATASATTNRTLWRRWGRGGAGCWGGVGWGVGSLLGGPRTGQALNTLFEGARYAPVSTNRHYLAFSWQGTAQRERLL